MRVLLLFLFILPSLAQARPCEVYGISDSPQALSCLFKGQSLQLRCVKGKYFLDQDPVSLAFHFDVEEGTVPLVFRTSERSLIVMMDSPITAELESAGGRSTGRCSKKSQ